MGSFFCFFFFLFHSAFTIWSSSSALCIQNQRNALLQFNNSFSIESYASIYCDDNGVTSYPKTKSWKKETDCCEWDGVTCENSTGNVIGLDLSCSWLQGGVLSNSTLFSLSHLQKLNLGFNSIGTASNLWPEFGSFVNLTYLNLSMTGFGGPLPIEISYLSSLVSLDLSFTDVTLENPVWTSLLQNLTQLTELVLDQVNMISIAPSSLLNLSSSLSYLSLSGCSLKGRFPETILSFPKLQKLVLSENGDLIGYYPKSLNWSNFLRYVDISFTNSSGELPNNLDNLKSLQYLSLHNCKFTGFIPSSLGNLRQITYLGLTSNNFTGEIPLSFSNLHQLTYLALSGNNLTGKIPNFFGNLSSLSLIALSKNKFSGHIPTSIFSLNRLAGIDLSNNQLVGSIPTQLINFPDLSHLDLSFNSLNGTIPPFDNMTSLDVLFLQYNKFHGTIPSSIFNLVNLTRINLSTNNLSGVVELDRFSELKNLEVLDLSSNYDLLVKSNDNTSYTLPMLREFNLSSCNLHEFPRFLSALENLETLDLSNNLIGGCIPKWMIDIGKESLRYMNLSLNKLTCVEQIPWKSLGVLALNSNLLRGALIIPSPSVTVYSISNNQLTGVIPSTLCSLSSLQVLDLSNNSLKGILPQCLGNFSYLSVLDLHMNRFIGTIPKMIVTENPLRSLNLNGNQLKGSLPQSLLNCKSLEVLDIGNNNISGSFPHWLESLPTLQVLVLRSNNFYGSIGNPSVKLPFQKLRIMDLSSNMFSGHLQANYFENLKAMRDASDVTVAYMGELYYQDSVLVTMKGFDVELVKILNILTTIDLSRNNFSGEIPKVIGNLRSLKGLNISHNRLTGSIPSSFGKLNYLEWLDLSSNELSGNIPIQLTDMTSLAVLNLSYNSLEGAIPRGKQFNTFDSSSYIGNSGLCGFPLSKQCRGSLPNLQQEDTSEPAIKFEWKAMFTGYGCGIVLGISLGYIVLSNRKVDSYLNRFGDRWHEKQKRSKQNARQNGRVRRRN